jgi:uncharacterized protein GlcG (DUF336 family)
MALTVTRTSLAIEAARRLVAAATAHAAERGQTIAVAVVDREGALLAFERMDGVPAPIIDFAIDKAHTAAVTGVPTNVFFERMDGSPSLRLGLASRSRLLVWGGGVPVHIDGQPVGAIGVSGGPEASDIECARASISATGLG